MINKKLTDEEIESLISDETICEIYPWITNDENIIDQFYKQILFAISRKTEMQFLADFDHYGSGYSSYIPTFFYSEKNKIKQLYPSYNQNFLGLEIYFCRIAPYFIIIENEQRWQQKQGQTEVFRGFPSQNIINHVLDLTLQQKAQYLETLLSEYGLSKLDEKWLETLLPKRLKICTNLNDRAFSYFDVFFHWED